MGFSTNSDKLTKEYMIGASVGVKVFTSVFDGVDSINPSSDENDKVLAINVWINTVGGETWDAAQDGDTLSYDPPSSEGEQRSVFTAATYMLKVDDEDSTASSVKSLGTWADFKSDALRIFKAVQFSATHRGEKGARQILYSIDYEDVSASPNVDKTMTAGANDAILVKVGPVTAPAHPPAPAAGTLSLSPAAITGIVLGSLLLVAVVVALLVMAYRRS
jgi:hypothetical protein